MRQRTGLLLVGLMATAILACDRAETPGVRDTTSAPTSVTPPRDTLSVDMDTDWRDDNGPVLVVAGDSASVAILVLPALDTPRTAASDLDSLRDLEVQLLGPSGHVGTGRLRPKVIPPASADECAEWPTAQIVQRRGSTKWSVGLASAHVTALPMDSLSGLHQPDSARLAAEIAKVASVTPNDTAPMFRGLPFRVQNAYRLRPSDSIVVIVATVVRTINQEANARTENLLLVAEQERSASGSKLALRYFERVSGPEESTETVDVLAGLLLGATRRPTIVLGRSDDSGTAFAFIERSRTGEWTLKWSSPYTDC